MEVYRIDGRTMRLAFRLDARESSQVIIRSCGESFYYLNEDSSNYYIRKVENGREYLVFQYEKGAGTAVIANFYLDVNSNIYICGVSQPGGDDISGLGFVAKSNYPNPPLIIAGSMVAGYNSNIYPSGVNQDSNDGSQAMFNDTYGIWINRSGDIYLIDNYKVSIKHIQPNGRTRTLFENDVGTNPSIISSFGITGNENGDIFAIVKISINDGFGIAKISKNGTITILAGDLINNGFVDGQGQEARFDFSEVPGHLAMCPISNVLYVMDDNGLRKVTESGLVTTAAPRSYSDTVANYSSGNVIVDSRGIPYVVYPDSFPP